MGRCQKSIIKYSKNSPLLIITEAKFSFLEIYVQFLISSQIHCGIQNGRVNTG